jgi:ankyrin repeat protein
MTEPRQSRLWLLAVALLAVGILALAAWFFSPGQQQMRRNAALINAVRTSDVNAAAVALEAGADANARDSDGITALMYAARGDRPEIANPAPSDYPRIVELMIKRGADINAKTDTGFVALFWAARYGHEGVARVLITHGADVNAKDKDGMTALKWASSNKQTKVVELLQEAGAKE